MIGYPSGVNLQQVNQGVPGINLFAPPAGAAAGTSSAPLGQGSINPPAPNPPPGPIGAPVGPPIGTPAPPRPQGAPPAPSPRPPAPGSATKPKGGKSGSKKK